MGMAGLLLALAGVARGAETVVPADVDGVAWWVWLLVVFVLCFGIGIVAALGGVGGGVLFVPIASAFLPLHLDYIRGAGLIMALHDEGITMNDIDPDYVIIGEGNTYNYENILRAVHLVLKGAKLIGTNSDLTGPSEDGIIPACRAMISPIEMATGQNAYFVGKPNPLMMRTGLSILGVHSAEAVMIGDRMDTDMVAGIETGLDTALVLSGVTAREDIRKFPYRPRLVLDGVGDIPPKE